MTSTVPVEPAWLAIVADRIPLGAVDSTRPPSKICSNRAAGIGHRDGRGCSPQRELVLHDDAAVARRFVADDVLVRNEASAIGNVDDRLPALANEGVIADVEDRPESGDRDFA